MKRFCLPLALGVALIFTATDTDARRPRKTGSASRAKQVYIPAAAGAAYSGYATAFDGTLDYITIPDHVDLRPTDITWSAWVYLEGDPGTWDTMMLKTTAWSAEGWGADYNTALGDNGAWEFWFHSRANNSLVAWRISREHWVLVTVAYDDDEGAVGTWRAYFGDQLVGTKASGYSVVQSTAELTIGGAHSWDYTITGKMDEITIWDAELSAANVVELYNGGVPVDPSTLSFAGNLVSHWRMGDGDTHPTLIDVVGGHNGTMTNMSADDIVTTPVPTSEAPYSTKSVRISDSQTNEYITVPDHADLRPESAFSWSGWVKHNTSIARFEAILAKGWQAEGYGVFWDLYNNVCWYVWHGWSNKLCVTVEPNAGGPWFHFVATYDPAETANGTLRLYIDGGAPASRVGTYAPYVHSTDDLTFGQLYPTSTFYKNQWFDEFVFYNIALSADQVEDLYNNGRPVDPSTLDSWSNAVAHWQFGDGDTYPTATDSKGSHDGTMTGMSSDDIEADVQW